jgi:hypothetical protein
MASVNIPPEPWERQKGETARAYEAFAVYRDLGAGRSINKTAQKLGKNRTTISEWSARNNWVKRCEAWDTEQDRIARQAQTEEIKKMRKRHADLATAMLVKAAKALQKIPDDEIKAGDISKMVDTAAKLERISRGDVGEVVEAREGGPSIPTVQFYIPDNHRDRTVSEAEQTEE